MQIFNDLRCFTTNSCARELWCGVEHCVSMTGRSVQRWASRVFRRFIAGVPRRSISFTRAGCAEFGQAPNGRNRKSCQPLASSTHE